MVSKGTVIFTFIIIFVIMVGVYICAINWNTYNKYIIVQTDYYSCYRVIAPFGIFAIEGEGEIGGGFIVFHGSSEFELREEYVVKYFDGNELKTKILDAEKTSLIVDGTFRLEKNTMKKAKFKVGIDEPKILDSFGSKYTYKVHIPYLPNVPQTTDDWIK